MRILVLSTSLHPSSNSRILAGAAAPALEASGAEVVSIDLRDHPLPHCDGSDAYADPNLPGLSSAIANADAVLVASPVYNFDVGSPVKNLIELTGDVWKDKVVGFLLAAGGASSYMAVMPFAASLMLDFRCLIVPRFVFATKDAFADGGITDADVEARVEGLAKEIVRIATALR